MVVDAKNTLISLVYAVVVQMKYRHLAHGCEMITAEHTGLETQIHMNTLEACSECNKK